MSNQDTTDRAQAWLNTTKQTLPEGKWFYCEFSGTAYINTEKAIEQTEGLLRRKPNTEVIAVELDYCENPRQAVKNLRTITKFPTQITEGRALVEELLAQLAAKDEALKQARQDAEDYCQMYHDETCTGCNACLAAYNAAESAG